jgi:hypothetical protein
MDEVDGRPAYVAPQSGHWHASTGVLAVSLSLSHSIPKRIVILSEQSESKDPLFPSFPSSQPLRLFSGADQPKATNPTGGGVHHENVSGK